MTYCVTTANGAVPAVAVIVGAGPSAVDVTTPPPAVITTVSNPPSVVRTTVDTSGCSVVICCDATCDVCVGVVWGACVDCVVWLTTADEGGRVVVPDVTATFELVVPVLPD